MQNPLRRTSRTSGSALFPRGWPGPHPDGGPAGGTGARVRPGGPRRGGPPPQAQALDEPAPEQCHDLTSAGPPR